MSSLQESPGVIIDFDTSHDTAGFFGIGTQARDVLDAAEAFLTGLLDDDLDEIIPGGGNSWQMWYANPESNSPEFVTDASIAADTLVVFVGARALGGSLGSAAPGSAVPLSGGPAWVATLASRGEGASDFGPWGGNLTVANDVTWDYSITEGTPGKYNLYSNILHEMGHVLGVGTSTSWTDQVDSINDEFLGLASIDEYGSEVPLEIDDTHWLDGTTSTIYGTTTSSGASVDPSLSNGEFKPFTDLDVAGLEDIGWEAAAPVPEPNSAITLLAAVFLGCSRRRRRRN